MSTDLTINDERFVPATEAGKIFGYSKDYFLLLSKTNKIEGKKIGNKWYVNVASAEKFFEEAQKQKTLRSEKIRQERKIELAQRASVAAPVVSPVVLGEVKSNSRVAILETVAVIILGLALGVVGYLGTGTAQVAQVAVERNVFERLAILVYMTVHGDSSVVVNSPRPVENIGSDSGTNSVSGEVQMAAVHGASTTEGMIIAPADEFSEEDVARIEESFSDEVKVETDPTNPNTGVVTPVFREGEGESYRFLMVPVDPKADAS